MPDEKPYFSIDGRIIDTDAGEIIYSGDFQGVLDISNGIPPKLGPWPPKQINPDGTFLVYEIVSTPEGYVMPSELNVGDEMPSSPSTRGLGLYNLLDATEEFMRRGGQDFENWQRLTHGVDPREFSVPTEQEKFDLYLLQELRDFRKKILSEEYIEYLKAESEHDAVEILDGLLDIIVVAYGTALSYFGPDVVRQAAHEVAFSNLSKVVGEGLPIKREDGKIMKPEGWLPPNIKGVLDGTAGY